MQWVQIDTEKKFAMWIQSLFATLLAEDALPSEPGGGLLRLAFPVVAIGLLFYFMMIRPERKKQGRHREMLANLTKNDRVVTTGGIKGVVSAVQRDQEEVTLTIDESTGTKIRVNISSIANGDAAGDQVDARKK